MTRRQLSLFVPPPHDVLLETVRRTLDPVQAALIPAHVTLCREDELATVSEGELFERLGKVRGPLRLTFGRAQRFMGHGVLLPSIGGEPAFAQLRRFLLGGAARPFAPHITPAQPARTGQRPRHGARVAARGHHRVRPRAAHRAARLRSVGRARRLAAYFLISGLYLMRLGVNASAPRRFFLSAS